MPPKIRDLIAQLERRVLETVAAREVRMDCDLQYRESSAPILSRNQRVQYCKRRNGQKSKSGEKRIRKI